MYELTLENANGDQLSFAHNSPFQITEIEGLNPPDATINVSELALIDGAKFNSAKLDMRTINVAFAIQYQAAANRIAVYKVLKSKQYVKLSYVSEFRDVFIEGYIQSINIDYFEMMQVVTVSILCPSPYFKQAQEIVDDVTRVISAFHFPFWSTQEPQIVFSYISNDVAIEIDNDGEVDCGLIIELYARTAVSNPKIYNYITQDFIGIDYSMQTADLITINTTQGQKSVTLLRNGVETNLFNNVMEGSTWLQLPAGGGTFVYELGTGNNADLDVTFRHYNLFEGV